MATIAAADLASVSGGGVLAQGASTPAAGALGGLEDIGLPTIDITITKDGFDGIPASLEAGRYLVTATGAEGVDEASAAFIRPPSGMSADDLIGALGIGNPPPLASPSASPEAEGPSEESPLPTFVYQMTFAGGAVIAPAGSGQVMLDLGPGEWILWADDPESADAPVIFTVP